MRGEIVGIAGVEGNGQAELLQALLHPRDTHSRTSGVVRFLGQDATGWDAARIRNLGVVAVIPEDRQREGLLLDRPFVSENFLLGLQRSASAFRRADFLRQDDLQDRREACAVTEYDIRELRRTSRSPLAAFLQGGNSSEKLVVAREFQRRASRGQRHQPLQPNGNVEWTSGRSSSSPDRRAS